MRNLEIARVFETIADILEMEGDNPFRIRAYRRAAQNVEALAEDLESIAQRGALTEIPGIGKDLAAKIQEYLSTGRLSDLERLKDRFPPGVLQMLSVPGIGPKKARLFYESLGVKSVDELEAALKEGRWKDLPGIRERTVEKILSGIKTFREGMGRKLLSHALPLGEAIASALSSSGLAKRVELAGSIRRRKETVGDLDVLVISDRPREVVDLFASMSIFKEVLSKGDTKSSAITADNFQVDLRVLEEGSFGAALQYFTGSKSHNVRIRTLAQRKGLTLSEYGLFEEASGKLVASSTEEEIYAALGMSYVEPELREDRGEVEAALEGKLPRLVELEDIRGDLHVHSNWSDGTADLEEMISYAQGLGLEYIAITDHTSSLSVAHGLDRERALRQVEEIREIAGRFPGIRVLCGLEVDVLPDGSLDMDEEVLSKLDVVVASVHSHFNMSREEMTRRVLRALQNPYVSILGHPTGRILGEREALDLDVEAVIREAAARGVALEVNSYPKRLDLPDALVKRAMELGATICVNTDAHVPQQFNNLRWGVYCARRGWATRERCLNALGFEELVARLRRRRPALR